MISFIKTSLLKLDIHHDANHVKINIREIIIIGIKIELINRKEIVDIIKLIERKGTLPTLETENLEAEQ